MEPLGKSWILYWLFLIGVGIVEMAIAAVIIYADPEHAIQNIQRTYFSKNGLPDEKEASIYAKNGVANFSGAFIQYNDPKNGKMGKNPDAHSLIIGGGGTGDENYGVNSAVFVGDHNIIGTPSNPYRVSNSVIFGGSGNQIVAGENNVIAGGGCLSPSKGGEIQLQRYKKPTIQRCLSPSKGGEIQRRFEVDDGLFGCLSPSKGGEIQRALAFDTLLSELFVPFKMRGDTTKFGDKKLNQLQDQVESFFDQNGQLKALDPTDQAIFQKYRQLLVELKHTLSTISGNMLKAGAMQGPAIALRNYLDQDSLGPLPLTEQFKVGPNTSTILQQGDDQILQIQGKIEGKPITFYYTLNNPQANLQCEDTLNYDKDNNQITIGKSQKTDLKIQMPTSVELITRLRDQISPAVLQELLKNANSAEEYQTALNELIAESIQEVFTVDPLVKSRICMHTEKNLATQELNATLLPPHLETQLNTPNIINNNPQIKKLLYMIDFSSENSTSQELQSFRSGLKKLKNLISNPQVLTTIKDPVLKSHLQKLHHS